MKLTFMVLKRKYTSSNIPKFNKVAIKELEVRATDKMFVLNSRDISSTTSFKGRFLKEDINKAVQKFGSFFFFTDSSNPLDAFKSAVIESLNLTKKDLELKINKVNTLLDSVDTAFSNPVVVEDDE